MSEGNPNRELVGGGREGFPMMKIPSLQSVRDEWNHYGDLCNDSFDWLLSQAEGVVELNLVQGGLILENAHLVDENRRLTKENEALEAQYQARGEAVRVQMLENAYLRKELDSVKP